MAFRMLCLCALNPQKSRLGWLVLARRRPAVRAGLTAVAFVLVFGQLAAGMAATLGEARSFSAFRVYFAGKAMKTLPLGKIDREPQHNGGRSAAWTFFYGTCVPSGEGLCSVPLQIQNYSTCRRWAGAYPGKPRLFSFRGAKAAWVRTAGSLEIYTGRTTVVIFARSHSVATSTARLLRTVGSTRPSSLPPPVPGSLRGELPCQGKPG